jgi:hypothetical protein
MDLHRDQRGLPAALRREARVRFGGLLATHEHANDRPAVDILKNFLNNDQIAALNNLSVPVTVQVPVGVAANVCGVSAAVLGKSGNTNPTCTARNGSKALANAVAAQKLSQKK